MLSSHPDASGLTDTGVCENEGQFLQDVYPRDSQLGGAGRFAFHPQSSRAPCKDAGEAESCRAALMAQWCPYWDVSRAYLIEKTPGNCLNAPFLHSVFGDACTFVILTRHPIANALATRKWSRTSLFALVEHWLHAHETIQASLSGLGTVAWISYENLVASPGATLGALRDFLGMQPAILPTPRLVDHNIPYFDFWHRHYRDRISAIPESIVAGQTPQSSFLRQGVWRLRAELRRRLIDVGLDVLSTGREAGAIINHYEDRVGAFGYSIMDTARRPPKAAIIGSGLLSSFPARRPRMTSGAMNTSPLGEVG